MWFFLLRGNPSDCHGTIFSVTKMYCTVLICISFPPRGTCRCLMPYIYPVVSWCAVSRVLKPIWTVCYFSEENWTILWGYEHVLTQVKSDRFRPLIWLASLQVPGGKPNIQDHVQRVMSIVIHAHLHLKHLLACGPTRGPRHPQCGLLMHWEAHLLTL